MSSLDYTLATKVMRRGEVYDVLPVVPGTEWVPNPSSRLPAAQSVWRQLIL